MSICTVEDKVQPLSDFSFLSEAVTQYRRQEWCQNPPPPSSLTSNYNDDSVYFHSLAFRRFGSPERHAISFNKIPPPSEREIIAKTDAEWCWCFALTCDLPERLSQAKSWEKSQWHFNHAMRRRNSITSFFAWSCLLSHSTDYLAISWAAKDVTLGSVSIYLNTLIYNNYWTTSYFTLT